MFLAKPRGTIGSPLHGDLDRTERSPPTLIVFPSKPRAFCGVFFWIARKKGPCTRLGPSRFSSPGGTNEHDDSEVSRQINRYSAVTRRRHPWR
jgi:hypothetical protein